MSAAAFAVSIQTDIQAKLETFPPSIRRVAEAILAHPQIALEKTISELARFCDTSETSVVRFCRSIGFTGFAPLKLRLAAELGQETAQFGEAVAHGADIRPSDSLAEAVAKIATSEIVGIRETANALDVDALQRVVTRIDNADKVVLFGVGASNAGPLDLAQKLLRIGRIALVFRDAHDALVSAALLGAHDVAIAFSHGGRTRESVELLRAARGNGAFTVAVTNAHGSPITAQADEVLRTAVRETMFRSGAMASRIAQLTLVDYMFVGVARRSYSRTVQALASTYDVVGVLRDDR
jgi:DNA-binding MurR/RpiR family transcriptional regulator